MLASAKDTGECDRRCKFKIYKLSQPQKQVEKLAGIYKSAYRDYPEYAFTLENDIINYLKSLWEESFPDVLVADSEGELLGFIVVDTCWTICNGEPAGEVHEFAIDYKYQGLKIGSTLFKAGIDYLESRGLQKIGLWVGNHNKPALALYTKYGFKKVYSNKMWTKMERQGRRNYKGNWRFLAGVM